MAKPCRYKLAGQDTFMSEEEFKKSLADGLLDKFMIDDKVSIPTLRGFKADTTVAEKFRAPMTETAPQAEVTPTETTKTTKTYYVYYNDKTKLHEVIDSTSSTNQPVVKTFKRQGDADKYMSKLLSEQAEAITVKPTPTEAPTTQSTAEVKTETKSTIDLAREINSIDIDNKNKENQDIYFKAYDLIPSEELKYGNPSTNIAAAYNSAKSKSESERTDNENKLIDVVEKELLPKVDKSKTKPSKFNPSDNLISTPELLNNEEYGWRTMDEKEFDSLSSGEKTYEGGSPKRGNWIAGVPESAAKFGKKGAVMVEFGGIKIEGGENMSKGSTADKSNVTKVWRYNNETNKFEEAPDLLAKIKEPKTETKQETKPVTETKQEAKPTTEKVERKGPSKVEAETKRGTKVEYNAEVSENGKTATVQQIYEAPFGGKTEGPKFSNLPIQTDAKGNRYVETKNETKVYVDKVKEAPKAEEETTSKEEQKEKRATVTISPSTRVTNAPNITFTKNNRTGKWETTDKNGNKFEANEDQAKRAEEALKEQQKEDRNKRERENRAKSKEDIKQSISDAMDKLKIPKDRLFSIPIPVDIHNKIVELAKRLILKGVDITSAIKQSTEQVINKLKSNSLITDEEAKKVTDYTNGKEFTDKVNEAASGEERISGIKKELTSEESKELSEDGIERMTIKEALDAGQAAIENGDVVPDKLITSIIGNHNKTTGQYEGGKGRPLTAVETAAMVHYKTTLDNDLASEYEKLNKALDSKDSISEGDARAEIARLEDKVAEYEVMANITGYQQGLSLKLRSMMLNSEYDLVKQKAKIRAEYGGKLPADVEQRLNDLDKQLRDLNSKLNELEKKRNAAENEEVVNNLKSDKEANNKTFATSKDGKIKVPTSLIRDAVIGGANSIDEIVDSVRDKVKEQFPKATDRQIRDAITNYGKSRTSTQDSIQKKINEMKRVGRLLSELEDVQNGIKKTKNKVKRDALTERERELKEKIKEELSKIPLTEQEIADIQAEKLENFKKRTEQGIKELQKKLDNKDFEKKSRSPLLDIDEEAAKLRAERENVKFQFDLEFEKAKRANRTWKEKLYEGLVKSISAPKGLIASLDFSAPFRQGAVFVFTQNPKKTLSQLGKQFEFWLSEKSYNEWISSVKSSEYYPLMKASGLYIAEENAKLTASEEAFMSNFVNKIPLFGRTKVLKSGKKIPGIDIYGRAERAYTGFLNNLRVQAFLDVAEKMADSGISPKTNLAEYKSWADYVNNATGRGTGGKNKIGTAFEVAAPALSTAFFSPRFLWSRLNITGVNPSMYIRMSPTARKQAIKRTLGFFGATSTILALAALSLNNDDDDETNVEIDPRSSDFAKVKIGNTRIDILAGTQQVYRTLAQAILGEKKNITNGKIEKLGEKFGGQTRGSVINNFFTNKLSPTASIMYKELWLSESEKELRKEEGEGDLRSTFAELTVPLYMQDIPKLNQEHGAGATTLLTLMSVFGIGVQNMTPKAPKSSGGRVYKGDFESEMLNEDSFDDFEKQERRMLEGF